MHMISGNRHRGSRFLFLKRAEVLSENSEQSRKKRKRIGKILLKLPKIIAVLGQLWYIVTIHTFMRR